MKRSEASYRKIAHDWIELAIKRHEMLDEARAKVAGQQTAIRGLEIEQARKSRKLKGYRAIYEAAFALSNE